MTKNNYFVNTLLIVFFTFIYLISRFQNLTSLPVFVDEAIYLRWSQIIQSVETLRFIPLTDGKQPLFMWLTVPFFKIFSDPLFAGRAVSIIAGLFTVFFLCLTVGLIRSPNKNQKLTPALILSHLLSSSSVIIYTFTLYLLLPFTFFFDRLALADNLLSMFGVIILYITLLQAKFLRLDLALILGTFFGLALLTKSPAIFFIILSLATVIYLNWRHPLAVVVPSTISSIIAITIYNILRLGPQFHMIALRNQDYVYQLSEILKHPLDPLKPHLFDIFYIFQSYFSLPLIILLFFLLFFNRRHFFHHHWPVLIIWFLLPLLANATFAKVFTARYLLFTLPPLLILFSLNLTSLAHTRYLPYFYLLFFLPNLLWIYTASFQPQKLNLPPTDRGYTQTWTSGWGIKSASDYLISRSHQANVIVGTEGHFGTLPDGLQIYTNQLPHLTVIGQGVDLNTIPPSLITAKNYGDEVYLLFNRSRLNLSISLSQQLTSVSTYLKPDGDQLLLLRL